MSDQGSQPSEKSAPVSIQAPVVADDNNREFPVPLAQFLSSLKHTPDEVWSLLLKNAHGKEKRPLSSWTALLNEYKGT